MVHVTFLSYGSGKWRSEIDGRHAICLLSFKVEEKMAVIDLKQRRVWDIPTRIFHWTLVILFGFSWWSAEAGLMDWHQRSGLMLCWIVLFRIIWGFVGSNTARFAEFLRNPTDAIVYLKIPAIWNGLGHNPIGGWSTLFLILLVSIQVGTGVYSVDVDGIESGPLSYLVTFDRGRIFAALHHFNFNVLLMLAGIHILAIAFYLVVKGKNLTKTMITGMDAVKYEQPALVTVPAWRAVVSVALTGVITYFISNGLHF
jgi:cytochrome b